MATAKHAHLPMKMMLICKLVRGPLLTNTTGLGFFAEGLRPSAKAQKPSAKAEPSGIFESAKRSLPRAKKTLGKM
jgi:hypothetical protein